MGTVARLFNLGGGGGASGSGGSGDGERKRSSQPPKEGHYLEGFAATQARMAEEELQATVALLRYLAKACPPQTLQRKGTAWYWWPMTDINHINTLAHQLESGTTLEGSVLGGYVYARSSWAATSSFILSIATITQCGTCQESLELLRWTAAVAHSAQMRKPEKTLPGRGSSFHQRSQQLLVRLVQEWARF
ncbi:hypothetical protein DFJ77DRAFT_479715 [Powellomyces hirtus]|nr:hypothetical protein DFJ77DRAFT_479715 [Powellomyces hirtus]